MQSNAAPYPFRPNNSRLIEALTLGSIVIALAIALVNAKLDHDRITETVAERAQAQAVSMATDIRWYVDVARQTLRRIAQAVHDRPDSEIPGLLHSNALDLPLGVAIMLYDAEGESVGGSGTSRQDFDFGSPIFHRPETRQAVDDFQYAG